MTVVLVGLCGPAVLAGPPLVCWKVETGGASSLPWAESPRSYEGTRSDYDAHRLAEDTLALLAADVPVLARMETLRRASIYASKDGEAGEALLSRLVARTREAPGDALAWFDAGYFVEALRQARGVHEPAFWTRMLENVGLREKSPKSLDGTSGYDCVLRAIELRGDAEMEYAAALITWYPRQASHEQHVAKAAAGAAEGSLLAENLLKHFGDRGRTLAELRANAPIAKR